MIYAFTLDPQRPWHGKLWRMVAGSEIWTPGRLTLHIAQATSAGLRSTLTARPRRKRRWWPWLLVMYGTTMVLAGSLVVAIWMLRHGI